MSTDLYLPQVSEPPRIRSAFPLHQALHWTATQQVPDIARSTGRGAYRVSSWCTSAWKRAFDLFCVIPALVLIAPFLALVALLVRLTSPGPVIFCQQRSGRAGQLFKIYKFRTMIENSERLGPEHTAKDDPRITPIGNILRRWKIDELPQLFNVLKGEMSLVGPRPKLPNHDRTIVACRPGITGAATLAFRNEQAILSKVRSEQIEAFYQEHVAPKKLEIDSRYMESATLLSDLDLLLATVLRTGTRLAHHDLFGTSARPLERHQTQPTIALHIN